MDFLRFETAKPLQTFSTSTTLRVRRSVRFLGHHSRRNIRKTTKIKQNPLEKGYKIKQIPLGIELLDPLPVLLLSSCVVCPFLLPPPAALTKLVQAAILTRERGLPST